jgi:uncharacterized protein (TIGR02646 family)
MRSLKRRPGIPKVTRDRLSAAKMALLSSADPATVCEQRFNTARRCVWFDEVRSALKEMAGESRTCMFCDHNEPTDVEHFKPKTEFPRLTFSWGNMLWVCTACNRHKGSQFPPHNCTGAPLIDPSAESVWDFFFLDQFGNLVKRWDTSLNAYHPRAESTCEYVRVDREEVQARRQKRFKGLRSSVNHTLDELRAGSITVAQASARVVDWLGEPFQADVADYFFRGPGRLECPFADLLSLGIVAPGP